MCHNSRGDDNSRWSGGGRHDDGGSYEGEAVAMTMEVVVMMVEVEEVMTMAGVIQVVVPLISA